MNDFTELHREIERARADLAADLTALLAKTDVKANVRQRIARAGRRALNPLRRPGRPTVAITGVATTVVSLVIWSMLRP